MKQPLKTVNYYRYALLRGAWEGFAPAKGPVLCGTPGTNAAYAAPVVDTGDADTEYNRLTVQGSWPNARLEVIVAVSDTGVITYRGEATRLDDFLAEKQISAQDKAEVLQELPHRRAVDTADLLLHGLVGRYLAVLVRVRPDAGTAPMLEGLRIEFPRCSFTEYLPEIYQQDDFFDRYVAVLQSRYLDLERRVDEIPGLLDYESTDEAHLRQLAGWLGLDKWSALLTTEQLKTVIEQLDVYQGAKGTRAALSQLMRLVTGQTVRIVEHFEWAKDALPGALRERMEHLYGADTADYCVILNVTNGAPLALSRTDLELLIDAYTPLGTRPKLVLLSRSNQLDTHCYLNINSALSVPQKAAAGQLRLGGDYILG